MDGWMNRHRQTDRQTIMSLKPQSGGARTGLMRPKIHTSCERKRKR